MLLPFAVAALVVKRVALGFGEGPAYLVALHAAYKLFPTGLNSVGTLAGNGIAAPMIATIIAELSWRATFGSLGAVDLGAIGDWGSAQPSRSRWAWLS